jgi:hypothetical protein
MTNEYDFVLNNMKYSYSSATTYETCSHGFKLTYIDAEDRGNNFYGEYGSFVHLVLEKFFKNELDIFELSQFFKDNYDAYVVSPPPGFHKNAREDYFNKGLAYFEEFDFDKSLYDIVGIEDSIETEFQDIKLIVKPDLILKHKETEKNILIDYKTANAYKNGKLDKTKMAGYLKQFYLYCYFLWQVKNIEIHEIHVWFVNAGKLEKVVFDPIKAQEVVDWFLETIRKIKNETEWKANIDNKFFCNNLCSVSANCIYKPS